MAFSASDVIPLSLARATFSELADQVKAAVDAYDATQGAISATVVSRQTAYDGELKLDGVILTIEWWRL